MIKRITVLAAAVVVLGQFGLFGPESAVAHGPCVSPGQSNYFVGTAKAEAADGDLDGIRADIERRNPDLCNQGAPTRHSWSLSWVGLVGPNSAGTPGISIFQGGIAKCPPSFVGSCVHNGGDPYHWWFYGREQGPCGQAFNTSIERASKGDAGPGTYTYKIIATTDIAGAAWHFLIDNDIQSRRAGSDLGICWGGQGVTGAQWFNEMLNPGDGNFGTISNKQHWTASYRNDNGWHDLGRPAGEQCDVNSFPDGWGCRFEPGTGNTNEWNHWDRRDD